MLKNRAKEEEGFNEALVQIERLPLKAADDKLRSTDTANRQTLLRIIQSIPSPQAEPFRLWLAQVGEEWLEEIENPDAAIARWKAQWRAKGRDDAWIDAHLKNDLIRNELTDEWKDRGAKEGVEYDILTNELSKGTFGLSVVAHKGYKLLPSRSNLRDHMTPIELALTSLSEAAAITYHRDRDSQGFPQLKRDTTDAGKIAGKARKAIEKDIGRPMLSPENYLDTQKVRSKQREEQRRLKQSEQPSLFDNQDDRGRRVAVLLRPFICPGASVGKNSPDNVQYHLQRSIVHLLPPR